MQEYQTNNYVLFTGGTERFCQVGNGFGLIPLHTASK
jgi:hypothetical protein